MKTENKAKSDSSTSLAELDPNELTDSDRLYHMAQAMRDDEYFDLPVVDWEKKNDAVMVTIVTPDGTTSKVQQTWPDKPTQDNDFVRTCMCALDISDPKSAALMADEIQDVNHDEFTVPAERDSHKWELKPGAAMPKSLTDRLTSADDSGTLSRNLKIISVLLGPLTLLSVIMAGMEEVHTQENWFKAEQDATRMRFMPQSIWYGILGTLLWIWLLL